MVKQLGWTVTDDLLCVQEDGTVLVYDLFGGFKRHFSMGNVRMHTVSKGYIRDSIPIKHCFFKSVLIYD